MAGISRKISSSTNYLFLILIILGFLGLINFLSIRHFNRLDLTKNKLYTLSDSSKKVVSHLDDIVTIKCYFSRNLPSYLVTIKRQINDILDEYRAYAKGNIQVEFIDPAEDQALEQKLRFMGIPQVQMNILEKDQATATNVYMGIAVRYADQQEVIPFLKDVNNLEYGITSSILKVVRSEKKTVGFLTGDNEQNSYEDYQTIRKELEREHAVEFVNLSEGKPVPEKINVLVVASPNRLGEREKYEIDQYIMRGGKVIFLIDIITVPEGSIQATYRESNLNDLLENYGVKVTKNLVLDRYNMYITFQTGYTVIRSAYPFFPKIIREEGGLDPDNAIVNQLDSAVFPWVSALEILKDSHKDLRFIVLARSSKHSWLQKGMYNLDPLQQFFPQPGEVKPYPVAVLVSGKFKSFYADKEIPSVKKPQGEETKANPQEEKKNPEEGKQEPLKECVKENQTLVVGSSRFIQNQFAGMPGNREFFLNAVDWFTWGKDLIGIRSRMAPDRPLPVLSEQEKTAIKYANLLGVPLLVALFGIVRFSIRKKKKITLDRLK